MNILDTFLKDLKWEDIPQEVIQRTKMLTLDLLGTAIAATQTPLATIIRDYSLEVYGVGDGAASASLMFDGRSVSLPGAALVGGMTIDALDAHDGHRLTKGHVGCALLPALLAVLEGANKELTGQEFLRLMVAGYEIGSRAGIALHSSVPDYHTSGAWNAITCAALGAHLLELDNEQFEHAIGIAEYHGPRSQMMRGVDHPTMLKDGSGWGAMAGVSAALMAQKGFTGAPALTVVAEDVAHVWRDLGQYWHVMDQYIKGFPVCRWAQPAVCGALAIREKYDLKASDIDSVKVNTFHEAIRLNQNVPDDTEQAQYAISFPIAAALVRGEVGVPEISTDAFKDEDILSIHHKITLKEAEKYNDLFPQERWADVEVTMCDGTVLASGEVTAKGDPETQFSDKEIVGKYYWLTKGAASEAHIQAIYDAVLPLNEPNSSLRPLLNLLHKKVS